MTPARRPIKVPMQIGSELRIKSSGEISVSNPTIELEPSDAVADAVLEYRVDPDNGDHLLKLVEPLSFNPRRES